MTIRVGARRSWWRQALGVVAGILLCVVTCLAVAGLSVMWWPLTRVAAAPVVPCARGFFCQAYAHVKLQIPAALIDGGPLGEGSPDENGNIWLSFWLPDMSPPMPDDGDRPFALYPDANKKPQPDNPRYFVSGEICPTTDRLGGCPSPSWVLLQDRTMWFKNQSRRASKLVKSITDGVELVDDIIGLPAFHWYFGTVGCRNGPCKGDFLISCPVDADVSTYRVCEGKLEETKWGFGAAAVFVGLSKEQIALTAFRILDSIDRWSSPNRQSERKDP